jgi:hypothetical protein
MGTKKRHFTWKSLVEVGGNRLFATATFRLVYSAEPEGIAKSRAFAKDLGFKQTTKPISSDRIKRIEVDVDNLPDPPVSSKSKELRLKNISKELDNLEKKLKDKDISLDDAVAMYDIRNNVREGSIDKKTARIVTKVQALSDEYTQLEFGETIEGIKFDDLITTGNYVKKIREATNGSAFDKADIVELKIGKNGEVLSSRVVDAGKKPKEIVRKGYEAKPHQKDFFTVLFSKHDSSDYEFT